jgi:hypothetical protein
MREGRRPRHAAVVVSGLVAVGLFTAGCSRPASNLGVAAVETSSSVASASASATAAANADPLAYSKCMRSHGVSDFPDPNGQGNIQIHVNGSGAPGGNDLDPNNPTFKAAEAACKSLSPEHQMTPAQQEAMHTAMLKYSQCMRAHGVPDFPDPVAGGGLQIKVSPGSDLDPENPQNKTATAACKQFQPKPAAGGPGPALNKSGPDAGQGTGGS